MLARTTVVAKIHLIVAPTIQRRSCAATVVGAPALLEAKEKRRR
jgi:hypothetical protein